MSLLGKLGGLVRRVAPKVLPKLVPGLGVATTAIALAKPVLGGLRALVPAARRALPGVGLVAAGAGLGGAFSGGAPRRRRRSRGITASELKGFKRVATIIRKFAPAAKKVPRSALGRKTSCR